jgi:hypothetical protein
MVSTDRRPQIPAASAGVNKQSERQTVQNMGPVGLLGNSRRHDFRKPLYGKRPEFCALAKNLSLQ